MTTANKVTISRILLVPFFITQVIYYARTGQEILTLRGHTHAVMSVAFSADGKSIISSAHDGTLKIWDGYSTEP